MRIFLIKLLRHLPFPASICTRLNDAYWDALLQTKESIALLNELAAEAMEWYYAKYPREQ